MKKIKKKDKHPLAINILKLQRYNSDFFNCEERTFFEYIIIKGMAFKNKEFFHSSETIYIETGIKKHSLKTIIKRFENLDIISVVIKGMPRVKNFTVNYSTIIRLTPQIHQLAENGKLLADYCKLLAENSQEKNNNKNNKKEKYSNESESELKLFLFNECLKDENSYQNINLDYNEDELLLATKEHDIEEICKYASQYIFNEKKPLKDFFTFEMDNKLKYIKDEKRQEQFYDEQNEEELNTLIASIQDLYLTRIKIHNKKDSTKHRKTKSKLAVSIKTKERIKTALAKRETGEIINSFTAYIDEVLNGELSINKILPYFFSDKDGYFEIIDTYLDTFNIRYSY